MATPSQIAANKLNSQKSTGPKTEAGKAKSCLNHFSHGFTSNTARLMDGENPEEFKALVADLMSEFEPATPTEQILVERMGQNQWLTLRAFRLQNEAFAMSLQYRKPVNANLALFIRYQATADRNFHKDHASYCTSFVRFEGNSLASTVFRLRAPFFGIPGPGGS